MLYALRNFRMISIFLTITFFIYLVTVPENILSIILWEMAGKKYNKDINYNLDCLGKKGSLLYNGSLS